MIVNDFKIKGLTTKEVLNSIKKNETNQLNYKKENGFIDAIKSLVKKPMLLLIASLIYFLSGKTGDGIFLSSAIVIVSTISLYQDSSFINPFLLP